MRTGAILLKFDIEAALRDLVRGTDSRPAAMTLVLPFVNVLVYPSAKERSVAAEIVLRVGDKRVLDSQECCDGCIDNALASLQDVRSRFGDARVALTGEKGALSGIIELMLCTIRQFLTFEQRLPRTGLPRYPGDEFYRDDEVRQSYFDALEQLRGHLMRCLAVVAAIAEVNFPATNLTADYSGPWPDAAYAPVDLAALAR